MVVGLLLLLQLEGWLVHVPKRRRDYVSRHSRCGQDKGSRLRQVVVQGPSQARRGESPVGTVPGWEWVELSRARWLQYSGGRSGGRTEQCVLGGGWEAARRPLKSVTGASWRPGACNCLVALEIQDKGSAVATPVGSASVRATGLGLGRSNVSKVGIFR